MKFSPTVTLALALAAGMTGTTLAQTTAPQGMAQPDAAQTAAPAGQAGLQPDQPATTQPQAQQGMQPQPGTQPQQGMQVQTGMQPGPGMSAQPDTRSGAGQATIQPSAGVMTPEAQRSEQVRQAQERLSTLGLYKGPTDGQMDPDTRAAIANFQQQNGIRRTASLDQRTLDRLLTGQTDGSGSSVPQGAQGTSGTLGSSPSPIGAGQ